MTRLLFPFALLMLLSACTSSDRSERYQMTPQVREELKAQAYQLAATEAMAAAVAQKAVEDVQELDREADEEMVVIDGVERPVYRVAGVDKVYFVKRYVDPSDSRVLHESHVIVREEVSPSWLTQAPVGNQTIVGPTITDSPMHYQPAVIREELAVELQRQRRENALQREQTDTLLKQGDEMMQISLIALGTAQATVQKSEEENDGEED